jgi:hypothetical protein
VYPRENDQRRILRLALVCLLKGPLCPCGQKLSGVLCLGFQNGASHAEAAWSHNHCKDKHSDVLQPPLTPTLQQSGRVGVVTISTLQVRNWDPKYCAPDLEVKRQTVSLKHCTSLSPGLTLLIWAQQGISSWAHRSGAHTGPPKCCQPISCVSHMPTFCSTPVCASASWETVDILNGQIKEELWLLSHWIRTLKKKENKIEQQQQKLTTPLQPPEICVLIRQELREASPPPFHQLGKSRKSWINC